jgi:pimeloyl-ACP methyl ester carboxylesterase/DNA-binding CsgD family transcriptional regulator
MEQQIRFCTTSDGVRIAYATVGDGPQLVYVCGWPGHLELEWAIPTVRAFLEALSEGLTLIRYDMRGSGLSDRDVSDFSLEVLVKDLEAVAGHMALQHFALLALGGMASPIAISYAATYRERVSHLVLNSSFLRGSERTTPERQRAMIEYTAAFGDPSWGATVLEGDPLHDFRQLQRSASSSQTEAALLRAMYSADVSHLVGRLTMPALVLHARGDPETPFAQGRELAIQLPNARFVSYEGCTAGPLAVADILISEIRRFLQMAAEVGRPGALPAASTEIEARPPGAPEPCVLTARELEVLRLIANGRTNSEIAMELVLSIRTVARHITNIYGKIGARGRADATAYAIRRGLT